MQKLQTVNADTLLYAPLETPSFVVEGLISTGLSLFCGSQKIGKSWLMLKLCLCVSQGIPLWDMPTMEGDVLYLCLEDTFCRIQDRLFRLTDEASGRLHFAVASDKLSDGLIVQLEDKCREHVENSVGVITAICPTVGYKLSADIAKTAIKTGLPVREILKSKKIFSEKEIDEILDPETMV